MFTILFFGMKKISLVIFISFIVLYTNISFWENFLCEWELWLPPCIGGEYNSNCECIPDWTNPDSWTPDWWDQWAPSWWDSWSNNTWWCNPANVYTIPGWWTGCCPGYVENNECITSLPDLWITLDTECLLNWQCKLNVYKVMWIRKSNENPTVSGLFQDVVLAATSFVWTVVVIALIVSGLIFAFGSISWKDTKKAKSIMIDCAIWLLLVMWSYTIIRLIQFLATAWS